MSPLSSHMHSFLRSPSSHSSVPLDDVVLCSSIPDSQLFVNEEQPSDGFGVAQPTCAVIHEEYEWDLEHQHSAKDDSLISDSPPFFCNLFGERSIHDFACVSMDTPIFYHSQDSPDVSPSFNNEDDKLLIENPLDPSFFFSRNIEDEFVRFSSTPLCDSSNHEDADQHPDFSDIGCCDLFTSSSNHDVDPLIVNLSKPLVYEDPSINEVETPQNIEAL